VAESFDWSRECVVRIARPRASLAARALRALHLRAVPELSGDAIRTAMARVRAAGALAPYEQVLCSSRGGPVASTRSPPPASKALRR
jgi:hypothetical protein